MCVRGVRDDCVNLCGCPNWGRTVCEIEGVVTVIITIEVIEERLTPGVGVPGGTASAAPSVVAHSGVCSGCCCCWGGAVIVHHCVVVVASVHKRRAPWCAELLADILLF